MAMVGRFISISMSPTARLMYPRHQALSASRGRGTGSERVQRHLVHRSSRLNQDHLCFRQIPRLDCSSIVTWLDARLRLWTLQMHIHVGRSDDKRSRASYRATNDNGVHTHTHTHTVRDCSPTPLQLHPRVSIHKTSLSMIVTSHIQPTTNLPRQRKSKGKISRYRH